MMLEVFGAIEDFIFHLFKILVYSKLNYVLHLFNHLFRKKAQAYAK